MTPPRAETPLTAEEEAELRTAREFRTAGRMIRELRDAETLNEAINVVAIVAKAVVEPPLRERLLPGLNR